MLKTILWIIAALVLIVGICSGVHLLKVAHRNQAELSSFQGAPLPYTANLGKTLVIYYSWTGHTQDVAQQVAQLTGADLYRVETVEEFQSSPAFYAKIKNQLKTGEYPAVQPGTPDFAPYDVIFVGSPVWWYTVSTPMLSFLKQTDFGGKKLVPFSTQGSNVGTFFEDFAKNAQHAKLLQGASFNNVGPEYNQAVSNKIVTWLNSLEK